MKRLLKKLLIYARRVILFFGAMPKKGRWIILLLLFVMIALALFSYWQKDAASQSFISTVVGSVGYWLVFITLLMFSVVGACNTLTDIYSLRKNETGITWCQIMILFFVGLWLIGVLLIVNVQKESRYYFIVFGVIGTLVTWIFQDTIKGIVAFVHLRLNHLLNIDDWIQVPNLHVDGEVKSITLTTVTIYNWDTTTSSIPTSVLHNDHFINLQKMTAGKTYGRQMLKTFIFDTGWFHALSAEEIESLKQRESVKTYLSENDFTEGVLNAQLFRLYLFHWLMNHPSVSQEPRLIVRWLEQKEAGMPLQVYAFIMEGGVMAFEWQQSRIIEHVIESLDWFGLQLYQSPSSYDVGNINNGLLTEKESLDKKEGAL